MAREQTVAGWVLEDRLGSGGFAEVWRARKPDAELVRALKLVRPVASTDQVDKSWHHEVVGLEKLTHPNIVRFFDAGKVYDEGPYEGYAWIAVELCQRSLADELRRGSTNAFAESECETVLNAMLAALAFAHGEGIVHRDIKPANILRHLEGTWKLGDFGIARLIPAGKSHPYTTVVGSTAYMSAAALQGHQDYAADLYALGVTLHEGLCGQRLHPRPKGMTDPAYHHLILTTPPQISPRIPHHWQEVIQRLIRAPNTKQAASDLHAWFWDSEGLIRQPSPTPKYGPTTNHGPATDPTGATVSVGSTALDRTGSDDTSASARRSWPLPVAIIVVLSLLVVGFGVWWFFFRDDSPPPPSIQAGRERLDAGQELDQGNSTEGEGTVTAGDVEGTWTVDPSIGSFDDFTGTFAGYRIQEELATIGTAEAVGRTPDVTGTATLEGDQVTQATFMVDMTTLESDENFRDNRLKGSGLETDTYPTASFILTEPIDLPEDATSGEELTLEAVGELKLHGVTRKITVPLEAALEEDAILLVAEAPIALADYDIEKPTAPAVVSIQDEGSFELQIFLARS